MSSPRDIEMDGCSEAAIPMEKESLPLGLGGGGGGGDPVEPSKARKPKRPNLPTLLSKATRKGKRRSEFTKRWRRYALRHCSYSKQEKHKYLRCIPNWYKGGSFKSCGYKPSKTGNKLKGNSLRNKVNHNSKAAKPENELKSSEHGEEEKLEVECDDADDGNASDEMEPCSDDEYERKKLEDELNQYEGCHDALFAAFTMTCSVCLSRVDDITWKRIREPSSPIRTTLRPELYEADPEPYAYTYSKLLQALPKVGDVVLKIAEQGDEFGEDSDSEEQASQAVHVSGGGLEGEEQQVIADAVFAADGTGKLDEE